MSFKIPWRISELAPPADNAPSVASVFCGGGGSSLGYKLAGFRVVAACDIDKQMAAVYERNLGLKVTRASVSDIADGKVWAGLCLDVLDGSPPCSAFSIAGSREKVWGVKKKFREGQAEQNLPELFFEFVRAAGRLRPKIVVAENVAGLIAGKARGYAKEILRRFESEGYASQIFLANAKDYGVPQFRRRVFFIARRADAGLPPFRMPPPLAPVTVQEALCGVPPGRFSFLSGKTRLLWSAARPGESFRLAHQRIYGPKPQNPFRDHSIVNPSGLARCFTATDTMYHWREPRRLTFAEARRICSFPDDYEAGSDYFGKYILGMSVPPFLAAAIAGEIKRLWLQK